jgi:glycosyltransferase involved in cell wall biosynthesis
MIRTRRIYDGLMERTSEEGARLTERARYAVTFAEHAALAARLRFLRQPRLQPGIAGRPLHVVLVSAYPPSHYGTVSRLTRWVPHLERLGCSVEVLTPSQDSVFAAFGRGDAAADRRYYHACIRNQWRNVRRAASADVVVLHRGLFPFSPWQRPTFERLLARANPHLVYDFYDPIWVQRQEASTQQSRIGRWLHPPDKIEAIIRLARVVTVSNQHLAEFARRHHGDVRVLPMLLDARAYQPRSHEPRSPVVLGWLGNQYQIPKLLSLGSSLRRLAAARDIVLRVVTSQPVDIPGVPVDSQTHPWSPNRDRDDLAGLDVGLLPLDDTPHDRGKSPLKLLQYAAAGLGIVATPVAIDLSVFTPGECFLPATNEDEWLESMTRLVDNPDLRARLGSTARKAVLDHYSFDAHAETFLDALRTAARQ